jgi:hypothetical protein
MGKFFMTFDVQIPSIQSAIITGLHGEGLFEIMSFIILFINGA